MQMKYSPNLSSLEQTGFDKWKGVEDVTVSCREWENLIIGPASP